MATRTTDSPDGFAPARPPGLARRVETSLGRALWSGRLLVVVAVVVTLLLAVGALVLAILDAWALVGYLADYAGGGLSSAARDEVRTDAITAVVKALDGCLIAALLVIVALGLYELFVNRLEPTRAFANRRLLRVTDLEDLKQRVAKLIVLVLAVEFFQLALELPVDDALDLLYLGLGILVISAALFLTGREKHGRSEPEHPPEEPSARGD